MTFNTIFINLLMLYLEAVSFYFIKSSKVFKSTPEKDIF